MSKIKIDNLADAIISELGKYDDEVSEAVARAVDSTAKHSVRILKRTSPNLTGVYRSQWKSVKLTDKKGRYVKVVCVRPTEYRLTHLLEKGHKKTGGGMVGAIPHIKPVRDQAEEELRALIKEAIE